MSYNNDKFVVLLTSSNKTAGAKGRHFSLGLKDSIFPNYIHKLG